MLRSPKLRTATLPRPTGLPAAVPRLRVLTFYFFVAPCSSPLSSLLILNSALPSPSRFQLLAFETRSLPALSLLPSSFHLDHSHHLVLAPASASPARTCVAVYPRDSPSRRVLCRSFHSLHSAFSQPFLILTSSFAGSSIRAPSSPLHFSFFANGRSRRGDLILTP